jgi:uncharacterized protein (DUF362 family)
MDGIVAMEGNGPGSGDPVPMKVLLFCHRPVALDSVIAVWLTLDPAEISTNWYGEAYGVGYCAKKTLSLSVPTVFSAWTRCSRCTATQSSGYRTGVAASVLSINWPCFLA